MKRTIAIVAACIPILSVPVKAQQDMTTDHDSTHSVCHDCPAGNPGGVKVPTYRCVKCGAPHGGLFYPLCPNCNYKEHNQPERPVTPNGISGAASE